MSPDSPPPAPLPLTEAEVRATRYRRRSTILLGILVVVLVGVIVAGRIAVPYYAIVPGQAQGVSSLVTVPPGSDHQLHGSLLLADVAIEQLSAQSYVREMFDSNADIVHQSDLTGGLPVSEFDGQGTVEMEESQITAGAVALRQLGYQVPEQDSGVTVFATDPSSPAFKALPIGSVVTSVGGVATTNPAALTAALHAYKPGDTVTLMVGSVTDPTKTSPVEVTLASQPGSGGSASEIPELGIYLSGGMGTQPTYDMPFPVSINSDNIGGPSAGLAFTLTIIDKLVGGDLTGGHVVAVTGTIRPDGSVGDVGGVAQKTVAVERAGATVFFVPPQELAVAQAHADSHLKVYGVSTLGQALSDLEAMGGQLGSAALGPPAGSGGSSVPTDWQDSPWS